VSNIISTSEMRQQGSQTGFGLIYENEQHPRAGLDATLASVRFD